MPRKYNSMRNKIVLIIFTLLQISCNSKQQENKINHASNTKKEVAKDSSLTTKTVDSIQYQISSYDNPEDAERISKEKETLKRLSEKDIFFGIHNKLIQNINEEQQSFFKTKPDYELLSIAKGSLFQKNSNDFVFMVYDKKNVKISILLYNGTTNTYAELYKDIKVVNGLKNANCNFYSFGTLDYRFANEFLVSNEEYLTKSTESYLEYTPVKITDISKDENFILKDGCFAKKISKTNLSNTLCIATSAVYNSWDCLRYDKTNNTFLVFYGQAFAD
jgi:hypothetical protein